MEFIKVSPVRVSSNGGYRGSTSHLLSPGYDSSGRTRLHSIELLVKGVPWKDYH